MFAFIAQKLDETRLGNPPKRWKSAVVVSMAVYFDLVEKFVYFLPRTELYINEQSTWDNVGLHVLVDYIGTFLCLLISPLIDNYHIHQSVLLACHCVICLLSIFSTYTLFLPPSESVSQASLLSLACFTQFTKPVLVSYLVLQLPERVGPPSKFIFTAYFTMTHTLIGFVQMALRWATHKRTYSSIHVLSYLLLTTYPVFIVAFIIITIIKRDAFCKPESKPGDTFLALRCLGKATRRITTGSCFESMLNHFDYTTVMNCKKAAKVLLIILALSFNSTILRSLDIPWMYQYFTLNRSGIFVFIEFNALCTFFIALFIPLTEYVLIPFIRKFKFPVPLYSVMICMSYFFTCLAAAVSVWMQAQTENVQSTKLDSGTARIYLINTLDTYSYVKSKGFPINRIMSASIKSYLVADDNAYDRLINIDFTICNLYYGADVKLVKTLKPKTTTAYVLTMYGAYEIPANGLAQIFFRIISDPSDITWPTLMFICPKMTRGPDEFHEFYPWCDAKVKIVFGAKMDGVRSRELDMLKVGNGTVIDIPPDTVVSVKMTFPAKFRHVAEIVEFFSVQGGKYVFLVWAGDVDLRVKYRLITVHTPPLVDQNYAFPQIIFRALGVALGLVSLCTMIKINTAHSLFTIVWAILLLSQKVFIPIFVILNHFALRGAEYQLPFVVANFVLFFAVVVAVRIART